MEKRKTIQKIKPELYRDSFQNWKSYQIPKAQLILTDVPYVLGKNAYASNPAWYVDGDNSQGESELAGKQFFSSDSEFRPAEFMHFCSKMLVKEPKETGKKIDRNTLEFIDDTPKFKPFDKVLVRNEDNELWIPQIFLMYDDELISTDKRYRVIDGKCGTAYKQCLLYEGNEDMAFIDSPFQQLRL